MSLLSTGRVVSVAWTGEKDSAEIPIRETAGEVNRVRDAEGEQRAAGSRCAWTL